MEVSLKDKNFICPFCHKQLRYSRTIKHYIMFDCDCMVSPSTWAWKTDERKWKIWRNINWHNSDKVPKGKQVFIFR
jgi:hypothetical protein